MTSPLAPSPSVITRQTTLNGTVIVPDFITNNEVLDEYLTNIHLMVRNADDDLQRIELIAAQIEVLDSGSWLGGKHQGLAGLAKRNLNLWIKKLEKSL